MKKQAQKTARTRAQIIAELATLPTAIQGKICEDRRVLASGKIAVYHNLQYWANGKNHTYRIPAGKVNQFKEAVKNGAKARELLNELTQVDTQTILSSETPLKKNSLNKSSKAPPDSTRS